MELVLSRIRDCIWGVGLAAMLICTGAVYTVKLKGIQFRMFSILKKSDSKPSVSTIRTVCMSLGAAMGTGNIAGTAAAIAVGGAGAVFWMWVSAFFGMALVYAENKLSAIYSDNILKGPAAYLSRGLGSPLLAGIFTFSSILAAVGMGGMSQANTFYRSLSEYRTIPPVIIFTFIFLTVLFITSGSAKRIGIAAQYMLPLASAAYGAVCVTVILLHFSAVPDTLRKIVSEALGIRQFAGGFAGSTLAVGIRRGVFSNEAGLGSSPLLHSSGDNKTDFAAWSMFEVFFDTMVCCTLTALTVLTASHDTTVDSAIATLIGDRSECFLAIINGLFALCTIIGWYYCGEKSFLHITQGRSRYIFYFAFSLLCAVGAVINAETVWIISDIFNALMAVPNLIGLLFLMNKVRNV